MVSAGRFGRSAPGSAFILLLLLTVAPRPGSAAATLDLPGAESAADPHVIRIEDTYYLYPTTDETAIEIMEWLRERISHIKLPKALDFHQKLPRTDTGKLYKRHLMEEYKGGARDDKPE